MTTQAATQAPDIAPSDLRALRLLADGLTVTETGRRIGLGRSAICMRMYRLRQQLGATTNAHALVIAVQAGLIDLDGTDRA